MPNKQKNNAIEKALLILSAFKPYNDEIGTVEIAQKLGLHKATVSRILQNLSKHGFVTQNPHSKKFRLGREIVELSTAMNQSFRSNLIDIAQPFIKNLRDKLRETIIFVVIGDSSARTVYIIEGPRSIRLTGQVGETLPVHASAGGKAVLAFLSEERRNELLKGKLLRVTEKTITNKKILLRQLDEIRRDGVAFDCGEFDRDTSGIAAPVFNYEDKPVAALTVAGPSQRITLSKTSPIASALKDAAKGISNQLHYIQKKER